MYDLGYLIVMTACGVIFGFSVAYNRYQKLLTREFNRGKEIGRASQRIFN